MLLRGACSRSSRTACCVRFSRRTQVVGDVLARQPVDAPFDEGDFHALPRARQAVPAAAPDPQRGIRLAGAVPDRAPASRNRGPHRSLEEGPRRATRCSPEIRGAIRRVDATTRFDAGRRAGLLI